MKKHLSSFHRGKKVCCLICDQNFFDQGNFQRHFNSIHKGEKYHCDKCNKSISINSISRHQELHEMREKGLKFHCKDCDISYTVKSSFDRHAKKVHGSRKVEPVIVLDETENFSNKDQKMKEAHTNQKSIPLKSNILAKPKKGMWIVKLRRLTTTNFKNFDDI